MQAKIEPDLESIPLKNPISADMAVMRTGLWCGLLDAALKNVNRQQSRVRLFEAGLRFTRQNGEILQEKSLAGLALGTVHEEQWGGKPRNIDFFDVKADVEALLRLTGHEAAAEFVRANHPALHPGQSAEIRLGGQRLGLIGLLHPQLEKALGFETRVFLFELDQDRLLIRAIPRFKALSKFPQVRRDLALVVAEETSAAGLISCVQTQSPLIRQATVFDVYQGPGIETGKKSIALGLVLQDDAETLTDAKVDAVMTDVLAQLAHTFNAKLRD
jgi:phenylalanyl-tRNA synthetase beta chain